MKLMVVFCTVMFAIATFGFSAQGQDQTETNKRLRSVAITFDNAQASAKRPLTQSEKIRRNAALRSQKRLEAGYNQPIPF